jgi:electron transport complex protein RnfC
MGGEFEKLGKQDPRFPWEELSPIALQQIIAEYGIVEMEGSGRPIADMLASLPSHSEKIPYTLVVRCVFDDPWLVADYILCQERLKAVVEGSVMIGRAVQARHILYAVSHREKLLGNRLLEEAANYDISASLVLVGSRYPQKNQRELELVLRNYEKKESRELGDLFILGPATLAAVHDAVKLQKPILDRYVAVGGSAVKTPQVMKVRIGTRLNDVFDECGGFVGEPKRIVIGSPLAGRQVLDLDEPVTKTSYAVFALLEGQIGGTVMRRCIGCGECRIVCPVELDPEALYKQIKVQKTSGSSQAKECHGCGCCDLVCPSRLPLSTVILDACHREV